MMSEFVRLNKTTAGFGKIIPANELQKHINDTASSWYKSLYNYDSEVLSYVKKHNGSIAGFKGRAFTNKLIFDLDNKDNLELARIETLDLAKKLISLGVSEYSIQVFFSSRKGFHLELLTNTTYNPEEVEAICKGLGKELTCLDGSIYNTNRLYRINNTLNTESNLYKVELDLNELESYTIEQIKDLAKKPRDLNFIPEPFTDTEVFNQFKTIKKEVKKIIVDSGEEGIRGLSNIDFSKCPKYMPRCVYALTQGVALPGERSRVFFILAIYYRNQGFNKDVNYNALKAISRLNSGLYPESEPIDKDQIWTQHIASAYSERGMEELHVGTTGTSYDNELLLKYCECIRSSKACILHSKKENKDIIKISEVSDHFRSFAQNIDQNTIKTGINFIDNNMRIMVGTSNLLVGSSGSGKTTLSLNIMENTNKNGLNTLFCSLDMHRNLIYMKIAQKLTNYSQTQIFEFFKNKDQQKIEEIKQLIEKHYSRTYFDFSTTSSLADIQQKVLDYENRMGEKIKLIVIDYASRLMSPYQDSYHNDKFNALKLVEVAENLDAAILTVCQVSRANSDGNTPLRSKRIAKGAGDFEESCRNQINIWLPFSGNNELNKVAKIYLAKNTMGKEMEGALYWDGAKSTIRDFTTEEQFDYEANIQPKEEELTSNKNKFSF